MVETVKLRKVRQKKMAETTTNAQAGQGQPEPEQYVLARAHDCHAPNCTVSVPPRMFMCRTHWFALPKAKRDAIWATYKPGQEILKNPSKEYLGAARDAVNYFLPAEPGSAVNNE